MVDGRMHRRLMKELRLRLEQEAAMANGAVSSLLYVSSFFCGKREEAILGFSVLS